MFKLMAKKIITFSVVSSNDCDMVDLLLEKGARVDIGMQGDIEVPYTT